MKITVHCLVRNEDIWIGYALKAVLPYVEKIIVFDNGPSTDKTVSVIKSINSPKIIFEEKGPINHKELASLRQEMIDKTETDWFLIVDADEIWPEAQLKKLLQNAENAEKNIIGIVNYTRNCVGDVYHYLPESFGNYQIAGKKGNLTIRLIRKTPTLKMGGVYPLETFIDKNGHIQNQVENLLISDCWYLHTSFLKRSSQVIEKKSGSFGKRKIPEEGIKLSVNDLPEVLNDFVNQDNALKKRSLGYETVAKITAPIINIKRKLK